MSLAKKDTREKKKRKRDVHPAGTTHKYYCGNDWRSGGEAWNPSLEAVQAELTTSTREKLSSALPSNTLS